MRNHLLAGAMALACSFGASAASAGTIVSDLADAQSGSGSVYGGISPQSYAQEFTTGSQAYTLTDIMVVLGMAGAITPSATLVADNGNTPGTTVLTTLAVPTISTTGFTQLTLTPASTVTLAADTNYWLVLSGTSGNGIRYRWGFANATDADMPLFAVSHDGTTWTTSNGTPFLMEVDGTPIDTSDVPEPAAWAMMAAGFAGIGAALRRKRPALRAA